MGKKPAEIEYFSDYPGGPTPGWYIKHYESKRYFFYGPYTSREEAENVMRHGGSCSDVFWFARKEKA